MSASGMAESASERSATFDQIEAETDDFLADVLTGLARPDKRVPCKYFYDARGSQLFDRICELPEYYPTRTELAIMREHAAAMAEVIPARSVLIEYGSGSSLKTRVLLDHLESPRCYAPVDVSREHLMAASQAIAEDYPHIPVHPVWADFTRPFDLPPAVRRAGAEAPRVVYFPGSTLGNFAPPSDLALMEGIAAHIRGQVPGGALIGLDLQKDPAVLEAAYNDSEGVSAAFNLNLLTRINRELDGDFDLDEFAHRAFYNAELGRIEIYLESLVAQTVRVAGRSFDFARGELMHTEYSCKYTIDGLSRLAARAGLAVERVFTDERAYFALVYCTLAAAGGQRR